MILKIFSFTLNRTFNWPSIKAIQNPALVNCLAFLLLSGTQGRWGGGAQLRGGDENTFPIILYWFVGDGRSERGMGEKEEGGIVVLYIFPHIKMYIVQYPLPDDKKWRDWHQSTDLATGFNNRYLRFTLFKKERGPFCAKWGSRAYTIYGVRRVKKHHISVRPSLSFCYSVCCNACGRVYRFR